jgi:ABC-type thiamin/hydroxymethylpyrimidine transport system permease subunit
VLAVSIRFFPQILDETKRILLALRLKGFKTSGIRNVLKTFSLVFVPLIINSFRQARVLALAAETRGFSAYSTHDGKRQSRPFFSTLDLITIAFSVVFLYVAILPFKMGLSRVPFLHPFFFSIPFTCILMIAVRLIPKLGSVTLLICGNSLFAQIISRGINPLWWPYALAESLSLEVYFFLTRNYAATATNTIFAGALRGAVVYLYFYYISSPYIWHKFYAPWYIAVYTIEGVIGSALGGLLGYKISNFVEKAYRYGGL